MIRRRVAQLDISGFSCGLKKRSSAPCLPLLLSATGCGLSDPGPRGSGIVIDDSDNACGALVDGSAAGAGGERNQSEPVVEAMLPIRLAEERCAVMFECASAHQVGRSSPSGCRGGPCSLGSISGHMNRMLAPRTSGSPFRPTQRVVLTLTFELRARLAYDGKLLGSRGG